MKKRNKIATGPKTPKCFELKTMGEYTEQLREALYQAFVRGLSCELDLEDLRSLIVVMQDLESRVLPGRKRITSEDRDLAEVLETAPTRA